MWYHTRRHILRGGGRYIRVRVLVFQRRFPLLKQDTKQLPLCMYASNLLFAGMATLAVLFIICIAVQE